LLLSLFTGLRRNEAAMLKWSNIDLKAKTLTILDTKNHQSHTLPLSGYLYDLLIRRQQYTTNDYIFPGAGKGGYIVEPRKQMTKVSQISGVNFTMHDLRRTFITLAESLDISAYAVKRLINHKMTNDVTAGYIISDVERLRKPMQAITDNLLKWMIVESYSVLEGVI
jgi:integrase